MRFVAMAFALVGIAGGMSVAAGVADGHAGYASAPKGERVFHMLKTLPLDAASYQTETAALVKAAIPEKFGHEEWAAVVLTNELHQHVGIYNVIGAKMGVRAREILEAPPRAVNVTAETGIKPPVSCLIDGLQVALGSTFAQDLIHTSVRNTPCVAAVFEHKNRRVRLSLKPAVEKQVADLIAKAVKDCGNLTPAYFEQIETCSYRVWAELDRTAIFDEETVN